VRSFGDRYNRLRTCMGRDIVTDHEEISPGFIRDLGY